MVTRRSTQSTSCCGRPPAPRPSMPGHTDSPRRAGCPTDGSAAGVPRSQPCQPSRSPRPRRSTRTSPTACTCWCTLRSVPLMTLLERPGAAGGAVAAPDVAESPPDLGGRVVGPVRTGGGHLRAGEGLRDAVGRRRRVVRVHVPAALADVEGVQAGELAAGEAEPGQQRPGDRARVPGGEVLGLRDLAAGVLAERALLGRVHAGTAVRP